MYTVDNPPPGHVLKEWPQEKSSCPHCAALHDNEMCNNTRCYTDSTGYIVVKLDLRHYVAEAVK